MLKISLTFVCLILACLSSLYAQGNILDDLKKDKPGEGKITIKSEPGIDALIGRPGSSGDLSGNVSHIKLQGYRINVFSGNDPRQSKDEALSKERQVKSLYPELSTYVTYAAPTWRLRVGDFETNEEAVIFVNKIKTEYPSLGREMYVVSDEIILPIIY